MKPQLPEMFESIEHFKHYMESFGLPTGCPCGGNMILSGEMEFVCDRCGLKIKYFI